jgi:hypothetical protein
MEAKEQREVLVVHFMYQLLQLISLKLHLTTHKKTTSISK